MKTFLRWATSLLLLSALHATAQDVRPGDDFYAYTNRQWLAQNPLSPDKVSWDNFAALDSINQLKIQDILLNFLTDSTLAENSPKKMLGYYYQSGMDTLTIEQLGLGPLQPFLDQISAIKDHRELLYYMARQQVEGNGSFWGFRVQEDPQNSQKYIITLQQTGAHLPGKIFYTSTDEYFVRVQKGYQTFVGRILSLIGAPNPESTALLLFDLEKQIADAHMSQTDLQNPTKNHHRMSLAQLEKLTPNIPWQSIFADPLRLQADTVNVTNPAFYQHIDQLIVTVPIETWRMKLKYALVLRYIYSLPFAFRDAMEDLNAVFSGKKSHLPRAERMRYQCAGAVLDKAFGDLYYREQTEGKLLEMIANINRAYQRQLAANPWMSKKTKTQALKKLKAMKYKLGYDKREPDMEGLIYSPDQYLQNNIRLHAFLYQKALQKLYKPADKSEWKEAATEVNAYYDPANNEFILTAGILQPPFFDVQADEATNYGAIGCIIAHEMTHAFDNNGRAYDAEGNLNDWWQKEDEAKFEVLTEKLVQQFGSYRIDTMAIDGRLTLGENIADLAAVTVAYKAFLYTAEGRKNPLKGARTARQQFFISYATLWRRQKQTEVLYYDLQRDPHAPNEYRVNGVLTNFTPFYEAFGLKSTDRLFKPAAARIAIW